MEPKAASCPILVCNGVGLIQLINSAGQMLLGYTAAELLDQPLIRLVADADREAMLDWLTRAANHSVPEKVWLLFNRAGSPTAYQCSACAMPGGKLVLIEARPVNETALGQQERQREYEFSQLIELSPFPLMVVEFLMKRPRVRFLSRAFRSVFGTEPPELPGLLGWAAQLHELILATGEEARWLEGIMVREEFTMTGLDGRQHICELSCSQFHEQLLVSLYDITDRKAMEEAIRASEENIRRVLELSPVPMCLLKINPGTQPGPDTPVIYLNKAFTGLLGYRRQDIPNLKAWMEVLFPDPGYRAQVAAAGLERMSRFSNLSIPSDMTGVWMTGADGSRVLVERYSAQFDDKLLICLHDDTERSVADEAIRASEARVRQFLDALPIGVSIMGPDHRLQYVNDMARELQGKGIDPEAGPNEIAEVYRAYVRGSDELYPMERMPLIRALQGEASVVDDMEIHQPDRLVPIQVWGSPVYDDLGRVQYGIVAFSDISERLAHQQELRAAKEAAETANLTKSAFLANMSHEIRTPMSAIIGLNHLLEKTPLNPKQLDYVRKIQASAHNLLRVINDILDFSKIEAGKLDLEELDFNLEQVLASLSALLSLKAEDKGLELIFDLRDNVPEDLVGDSLRLEQILLNLVNNAIKFTPSGSVTVAVRVEELNEKDVLLRFCVSDTGIGLSADQRGRLFQAFHQADSSTTRQYGGTGLGLSISKRLAELMDGEIGFDGQEGQGSTFWFTSRFRRQDARPSRQTRPAEINGMQALVVDDQQPVQEILSDYLRGFGMNVLTADSGVTALEVLNSEAGPDIRLVLLDWKMPELDGVETLSRLRHQLPAATQPAVILMTAYGREDLLMRLERQDVDGILLKPLTPSIVYDAILEALQLAAPVAPGSEPEAPWREQMAAYRGMRLLLVEDNQINQQVAQELLEGEGFRVRIAGNGELALAALREESFDLVLMDLQMPVMDGYTATRRIRENPAWDRLPVLAMTADALAGVREQILEAGMNDSVTKPIDMELLFGALLRWLPEPGPDAKTNLPLRRQVGPGPELPPLPGIDTARALKRVSGDRRFYLGLLDEFRRSYADFGAEFAALDHAGDQTERYRKVHTLTGVAGNLGMTELEGRARALENELKAGKSGSPEPLLSALSEMLTLLAALPPLPGRNGDAVPERAASTGPDPETLHGLEACLETFDPKAQDWLDRLSGIAAPEREALQAALDSFDFERALGLARALRKDPNPKITDSIPAGGQP